MLSMWMKASPGLSTTASISLRNTYVPPPEYPAQYSINSGTVSVGDTWTRVSVSGYLLEYPTSDYQIYIDTGGPSGTYLSIDGVQLEEGPSAQTTIGPRGPITADCLTSRSG